MNTAATNLLGTVSAHLLERPSTVIKESRCTKSRDFPWCEERKKEREREREIEKEKEKNEKERKKVEIEKRK